MSVCLRCFTSWGWQSWDFGDDKRLEVNKFGSMCVNKGLATSSHVLGSGMQRWTRHVSLPWRSLQTSGRERCRHNYLHKVAWGGASVEAGGRDSFWFVGGEDRVLGRLYVWASTWKTRKTLTIFHEMVKTASVVSLGFWIFISMLRNISSGAV